MTILKRLALTITLILSFSLLCRAQEQTPSVEVNADVERAQFSAQGEIQQMRVEVFAPSGEKIFDSGAVFGQTIEWNMRDKKGERVADGVYLASVSTTAVVGKATKRVEQVVVTNGAVQSKETGAGNAAPTSNAPVTTANGTAGKIAKFTSATAIGDSIISESAEKVGVGTTAAPTATLQVNGAHPASVATAGKAATTLLQTSGGQGGNTTGTTGQKAGAGASLSLVAGNGGDAPAGGKRGDGGSITLQPGSGGGGAGTAGVSGNVLIAPSGVGNVAIGVNTAADKLTVKGVVSSTTGGFKFPDGSTQTTAGLTSVATGSGLSGDGTPASPLELSGINIHSTNGNQPYVYAPVADIESLNTSQGVALHLKGFIGLYAETNSSSGGKAVWGVSNYQTGVEGDTQSGNGVYGIASSGNGVKGYSTSGYGVRGETSGSTKYGVYGYSSSGGGVFGKSEGSGNGVTGNAGSGAGLYGVATSGMGAYGQSTSNSGVFGLSTSGDGVTGQSASGYAGHFYGKTKFTNNLEISGNELFGNTTRQMINLFNLDYGIGIQAYTLYFRSASEYNWYKGGVHSNTRNDAGGGTRLMRLDPSGNLIVTGSATATNFVNSSDRNVKANFSNVNPRFILDRLATIPVQAWNYKSEPETVRHIGPVAQDFRAAFNLGVDDKTISTVDASGVTMAAVQGLYQMMLEKEKANEEKDRKIERLSRKLEQLENQLEQIKRDVQKQRATGKRRR